MCYGTYGLHACCSHLFSLNCNMRSPWWPHTLFWLSKPVTAQCPGLCKWWPPWPPFSSALVTGWYQCHWCLPCKHVAPLYKRAGSPSPLLTFWLNLTQVTSRSKTRHLTQTCQTVGLLNIHLLTCLSAGDLHLTARSLAIAW